MDKLRLLILVNGKEENTFGVRARNLTRYFDTIEYKILYRKGKLYSLFRFLIYSFIYKSDFIYIINIGYSGTIAGVLAKSLLGKKLIIDIGDINYKLFKSIGINPFLCLLEKILEHIALRCSNAIITRGRYFRDYLEDKGYKNVYYIPDGVDVSKFKPAQMPELKKKIAPNGELIIGVVGSLKWIKMLGFCYGWDLVEMLNILKDKPIKGIIIGDGSGKERLQQQVKSYGIDNKIFFTGWVSRNKLVEYINILDICLSTQTNDEIGWMRTTGKLPLYLACGKYVLAADVGEAHSILPPQMLLSYKGRKDLEYPKRLASAVNRILQDRQLLKQSIKNRGIALENFDYEKLSRRLGDILKNIKNV